MGSPQAMGALMLGVVAIFLAPALVWAMVIAGLVRIVRKRIEETRPTQTQPTQAEQAASSK